MKQHFIRTEIILMEYLGIFKKLVVPGLVSLRWSEACGSEEA
jgi:hypothetical protein